METNSAVVNLNVGGTRFATSKETLSWVPDSFFSSLLSGRISSHKDDTGAIFIDRDPDLFKVILNFLRTRELDVRHLSVKALRKEAEYFGITPLVNRLTVCEELNHSSCGNVLFHGVLPKPSLETCSNSALPTDRTTAQTSAIQACTSSRSQSDFTCDNKVQIITGHNSWIAVAFAHHVVCYKVKESYGWQQVFVSPRVSECVERAAINAKVQGMAPDSKAKMVSVAFLSYIRLWSFQDEKNYSEIGTFNMDSQINAMFFIGSQLVAHGTKVKENSGVVGVWNAVSQHWQGQDVVPITSHDTAGAFLLLGGANGAIYYIDMQKFPLRLKDNDLLITELYRDHSNAAITALSVYLTPKTNLNSGNWIEVAYGTVNGSVCVVVQHPELVGQGFQLFQTFTVHQSPVYKVMLSEKHLVSVCSDNNHVRTWNVTRFRGMISTQPGSMPHASFKVLALDPVSSAALYNVGNNIGPHGEREEIQVFIQKLLPLSDVLYVRLSSNGKRIAQVRSMDGSAITCFCMHECDGSSRMGARPRRYLFTGHENGTVQIWDMTTALDLSLNTKDDKEVLYGPTQQELLDMLGQFDLSVTSNSPSDPQGASPSPVSDILERVLQPRSSHSSLTSLCSAFADATFNDVDGAAKQWSAQPSTSKQSQHSNVTINDPRSSSVATETEPPANQRFAKANNIKRRHSQVIESSSSDLQLRHNRHLSVSVINSSNPLNPPFSPVGGVPLPGLAPMEPSAPEDAPKRPEKERAPVAKKSSFRDVTVRNLEFSAPSRNPERQGPASPDDVRVGRRASQNKGAKGQVTSLLGEGEGSQGGRGGAFRNSYKSAINDSTENTNSK